MRSPKTKDLQRSPYENVFKLEGFINQEETTTPNLGRFCPIAAYRRTRLVFDMGNFGLQGGKQHELIKDVALGLGESEPDEERKYTLKQ